ncbi:MAG: HAMP domain-containing histidine kinase [Candidatus Obscuribacterales bacterium]|nr:HAMP domain-containing histidine kinase [Candidatus Obscuribacterales bacterium]
MEFIRDWHLMRLKTNYLRFDKHGGLTPGKAVGIEAEAIKACASLRHRRESVQEQLRPTESGAAFIYWTIGTISAAGFCAFLTGSLFPDSVSLAICATLGGAFVILLRKLLQERKKVELLTAFLPNSDYEGPIMGYLQNSLQKLIELEEKQQLLTDYSSKSLAALTKQGTVIWANQTLHDLLGPGQLLGVDFSTLLSSDSAGEFAQILDDPGCSSSIRRLTFLTPTGGSVILSVDIEFSNSYDCLLLEGMDISKEVEIEKLKNDFAEILAHDFRSPLSTVMLVLESVKRDYFPHISATDLQRIDLAAKSLDYLNRMTEHLIVLHKCESGALAADIKMHCLVSLLQNCVDLFKLAVEEKGLRISLFCDEDIAVRCDAVMLEQVVSNLLSNAVKFSHANGLINISAERAVEFATVTVTDCGPGIQETDLTSIFDKYKQTAAGAVKGQGVGLGLSIARAFILAQGGEIWVESSSTGAVFKFTCPIARDEDIS